MRWLPRPDRDTYAFLPVFSEALCENDPASLASGLDPACVRACPTDALLFGDLADPTSAAAKAAAGDDAQPIDPERAPEATDLKADVVYHGLENWMCTLLNRGAALDPRDEDPIYEQNQP